jgi:hypothetical protein
MLTADQIELVNAAAALVPPARRDAFLYAVASQLSAAAFPLDSEVRSVVQFVLSCYGIAVGSRLLRRRAEKHYEQLAKRRA